MTRALPFALLLVTLAMPSFAQTELPAEGTWQYVGDEAQNRARIQAIDAALEEVPRMFRSGVRRKLLERTEPAARVVIERRGEEVFFSGRANRQVTLAIDGTPKIVRGYEGPETLRTWISDRDGRLRMHGESREEGNARVITYDPHGDEMTIFVHITSERLEKDIDYRLSYRRAE
ncbi:MAG: hypothetical protein JJ863_22250 [Deltaproteobacteria bacterium]|nr:hypothetical protein [Deltaproteobacteria bacterium]